MRAAYKINVDNMAKYFHVVRVYGDRKADAYNTLGERVHAVGRIHQRYVHVYPFNSGFVEEHPAFLLGILQSSDGVFVCPSLLAGEFALLAFSGEYSIVRAFYRELFREYNLGNTERRSVSMIPEADSVSS